MNTLSDLKKLFNDKCNDVNSDLDIQYDWDCGHCYSYLVGVPDYSHLSQEEQDEFEDLTNLWLYDNDECPPCEIGFGPDMKVESSCGCHDHLDYVKDREDIENIILWLTACGK